MKNYIVKLFLSLEAYGHWVDMYFASRRGDKVFASDCYCRFIRCRRQLELMGV